MSMLKARGPKKKRLVCEIEEVELHGQSMNDPRPPAWVVFPRSDIPPLVTRRHAHVTRDITLSSTGGLRLDVPVLL